MNITKRDLIFFLIALVLLGGVCLVLYTGFGEKAGEMVEVYVDSRLTGTYPLAVDRTVQLDDDGYRLTFEINRGSVRVLSSDCPGQDCVHTPSISRPGASILCAHQKIVLTISSAAMPDAVIR